MQLIIPVAIKPYIKKFIGKEYQVEPFVLSTNNLYGIFLFNCLQKPSPKLIRSIDDVDSMPVSVYNDTLKVMISENYWNKYGCIISPQKQYHFNKFVAYQFNEEFYKYVKNRIGSKGSINKAIITFRDNYDISEDELSFKTIQRAFQRRNQSVNTSLSA